MARKDEEYLFVDGYNIINSWSIFEDYKKDRLEEARNKLIEILVEYQVYSGIIVTVVFDAHLVKGNSGTREVINQLEVVYTKELETADHYIERQIDQMGRLKKVKVATSDRLEQEIVLARGATRISARELEMEIFGKKDFLSRKSRDDNQKNDIHFGRLNDKALRQLKNIKIQKNKIKK